MAKYKNITKAAAAMQSSQPNVTRVMRLLEEGLQCKLILREARGISLTEDGERLYSRVETAFHRLMNVQEEIASRESDGTGTIEIGATETALHLFLLDALREFKEIYPRVRIKIRNNSTPEILKSLAYGRLDFAVVTAPFEISAPLVSKELKVFREILAGGLQYKELSEGVHGLDRLKSCPWVLLGSGTATHKWYREFFLENGVDIEPDTEVATSDLLLPLITDNMGIGFVPKKLAKPLLKKQKIVRINTDFEIPVRRISLVYDKGRGKNAAACSLQRFLENIT